MTIDSRLSRLSLLTSCCHDRTANALDPISTDDLNLISMMSNDDQKSDRSSITSDSSSVVGEIHLLLETVEEPPAPLVRPPEEPAYGCPLDPQTAAQRMPDQDGGLVWIAHILPDNYVDRKSKDLDANGNIKPRRPSLPIRSRDFLSSLTPIDNHRYIFHGRLNGWPGLQGCLEVISLEQKRTLGWQPVWKKGQPSSFPAQSFDRIHRAILRGAPWTGRGWSPEAQGHCFWFRHDGRLAYGTQLLDDHLEDSVRCTHVHMLSHRYAVARESPRDRLTYHSICLLEWDAGEYCTVVEAAYLNGIGGYKGRSNWFRDRDADISSLYQAMPPEMICPWRTNAAEIRCYDVPCRGLDEFRAFVQEFQGPSQRFVDPQFSFSHPARLTFRSRRHIAQYLINYISRDASYAELKRNCQTFTADLCNLLAGKKDVVPFHPVSRMEYTNRTHLFLYDSHMFQTKAEKRRKNSQHH